DMLVDQSRYSQMGGRTQVVRYERIGRFLNAVMYKPIGVLRAADQLQMLSVPQMNMEFLCRCPMYQGQSRCAREVPKAREFPHCFLCGSWESIDLADHQINDIIGIALDVYAIQVPEPPRRSMVEPCESLFHDRADELNDKKRIAGRLLV